MTEFRIGIDLGGTKTEVILLNGDSQELFRTRIPTVRNDYAATLRDIAGLVQQAEAAAGQAHLPVGIGIPGTISRKTGCVKNANATWLNGKPFQQDLSGHLQRPVQMTNDANCLAVSEAVDGAGRGYDLVFAGILGTGCGAGLVYRGIPLVGPNGVAGEWGHNPLPWTAAPELEVRTCYCGKRGCQETFLSGTGLCLSYRLASNRELQGHEIVALARARDALAAQVLDSYIDQLARGLAAIVNVIDPDVIVLGGGASNIDEIYNRIPERLSRYVFGGECDTPVKRALHGDSSGVRGAAWLNPLHNPG
ncbi:ROK family protein [Cellvibrio japonicus]|uniref:Probable NAGC-like transcription regulator yajF n=1 Tax=Cellvibrio japonicus (strain Ueda107) TaxID=498211 RepID=B3PCF5_CELJU|nr:ROK family protein [Cellvibrio japonicus]ACE85345.1 probable NAGC-like transcription regulator yajF [Cellvibrio japonicus Ueda107]QEI11860.1 ROK family protein [Cellvibrio japonicus]QEI15434.1 ROK family protein [Cellvibrio japonicus]QEI19013.1 ROK family protein [Cellvibrio japonicus]